VKEKGQSIIGVIDQPASRLKTGPTSGLVILAQRQCPRGFREAPSLPIVHTQGASIEHENLEAGESGTRLRSIPEQLDKD
jgi:hypothetical protein